MILKHVLIKIIIILILISYNIYSQTFYGKSLLYLDKEDNLVVLVYNKTNNTLRMYGLSSPDYLISNFKTFIDIVCAEFIIKNNKATYNKAFYYAIYDNDITIEDAIDKEEVKNMINNYSALPSDKASVLNLFSLLLIADLVSINDKRIEIAYKNYKRTIKPLVEEKNKVSSLLWYFFLKEKLAEIN